MTTCCGGRCRARKASESVGGRILCGNRVRRSPSGSGGMHKKRLAVGVVARFSLIHDEIASLLNSVVGPCVVRTVSFFDPFSLLLDFIFSSYLTVQAAAKLARDV